MPATIPGGGVVDTTLLIAAARAGDKAAEARLFEAVYGDLQRMAQHHLLHGGSSPEHAQSLVHELYLRLAGDGAPGLTDRRHFFALASRAMRQIVIDHLRRRGTAKRGDGVAPLSLDALPEALALPAGGRGEELLQLDAALQRLEHADPALARLVELHFFGGLGFVDMATLLERSERSLKRDWAKAKAFLYRELAQTDDHDG